MEEKQPRNYIKYHRVANKLKQYELAELLGVHQTSVCAWENGKANPLKKHIKAMMDLFHCTYEELFPHENPNGYEMPERFIGKGEEAAEDDAEDEGEALSDADLGIITLNGPWNMREYRADAEGDALILQNGANSEPVPIDGIRKGGPWMVRLIPVPKTSKLVGV